MIEPGSATAVAKRVVVAFVLCACSFSIVHVSLTEVMWLSFAQSFLKRVIPLKSSRDCKWLLDKCRAVSPVKPSSPFVSLRLHSVMLRVSKPVRSFC